MKDVINDFVYCVSNKYYSRTWYAILANVTSSTIYSIEYSIVTSLLENVIFNIQMLYDTDKSTLTSRSGS